MELGNKLVLIVGEIIAAGVFGQEESKLKFKSLLQIRRDLSSFFEGRRQVVMPKFCAEELRELQAFHAELVAPAVHKALVTKKPVFVPPLQSFVPREQYCAWR